MMVLNPEVGWKFKGISGVGDEAGKLQEPELSITCWKVI
jgi:hypothetical protein